MLHAASELLLTAWASFRRLLGVARANRGLRVAVVSLLAIDLLCIVYFGVGKMLYELGRDDTLYNHKELLITTDGGVPEWFMYGQTVMIVVLLVRLARSTRQPLYASLAFTYLVVVLDDAMEIHESGGMYFARGLHIRHVPGLRGRDVGELITWALLGALVVRLLMFGFARSSAAHRGNGLAFLLPFGALLFCGAFIDQLYSSFWNVFVGAGVLLDVAEDGGEMLAITAMLALALAAEQERKAALEGPI